MEIVVCIKQVPGTTQVEIDEKTGVLKRDGVDAKMNPYDLYAIETAVRLKAEKAARVTALSMGPPQAVAVLREAYMMGVDDAVLLSDRKFAGADVLATSYTLAQGVKVMGNPDLIICGKMTTDGDTGQVGPEMAEFLRIPHVVNVRRVLEVREKSIIVEIDMPYTVETAEIKFPCLITVEKGIYQPRLPSYRLKLATKDKEIRIVSIKDFADQDENHYGLNGSSTQVKRIFAPAVNQERETWTGTGEELTERLLQKLQTLKFV